MLNDINSVNSTNNTIKNQLVNMINTSGKTITEDKRPIEVRIKEENAQHQDRENKKQLEIGRASCRERV